MYQTKKHKLLFYEAVVGYTSLIKLPAIFCRPSNGVIPFLRTQGTLRKIFSIFHLCQAPITVVFEAILAPLSIILSAAHSFESWNTPWCSTILRPADVSLVLCRKTLFSGKCCHNAFFRTNRGPGLGSICSPQQASKYVDIRLPLSLPMILILPLLLLLSKQRSQSHYLYLSLHLPLSTSIFSFSPAKLVFSYHCPHCPSDCP